jgi:hypothetical protein
MPINAIRDEKRDGSPFLVADRVYRRTHAPATQTPTRSPHPAMSDACDRIAT